jgi:hypothetical protein
VLARSEALVAVPALVRACNIMPISARNVPCRKYVLALGSNAGSIVEVAGPVPAWLIPADGRMVSGFDWPDLFVATRGRKPSNRTDDWIRIWRDDDTCLPASASVETFLAGLEASMSGMPS